MSFAEPPSRRERLSRLQAFSQAEETYDTEPALFTSSRPGIPEFPEFPETTDYPDIGSGGYPWDTQRQPSDFAPQTRSTGPFEAVPEPPPAEPRSRGLLAGAVSGLLAAGLSLGIANLVAAFVRPQASPIIAVGGAFIDRTPAWLKDFAVQRFGENDKNVLLLGMYVTIALLAMGIGMIAWRHVSAGIVALALFGGFGAFVAFTRPESHTTDIIPSIAGGLAGIAAIVLLVSMGRSRSTFQSQSNVRTDRGY
jgi:hypothetical protein